MKRSHHHTIHARNKAVHSGYQNSPASTNKKKLRSDADTNFKIEELYPKNTTPTLLKRSAHEARIEEKKQSPHHAKRTDSLIQNHKYKDEHPLSKGRHDQILTNRKLSDQDRSHRLMHKIQTQPTGKGKKFVERKQQGR